MQPTPFSYKLTDKLQIEKTDFEVSHKAFLVLCGKKQFYCSFLVKEILVGMNENKSVQQIHSDLNHNSTYQKLMVQDLEKIIDTKIRSLGILINDQNTNSPKREIAYDTDSIKTQRTLLNEAKTHFLATLFKSFYQKWLVIVFVCIGFVSHSFYFISHSIIAEKTKVWIEASALEYILIYLLIILVFIFHEIGHASAALHFRIRTPRIGYGFYLVYPVFFTEISEAWKLQPKKRMVINLGGVYFQWIAGSFFIFLDYLNVGTTSIWSAVVAINFFRLFYSFIPFMKADGYWIFSDGFGLRNLRQKSNQFLGIIFKSFSFQKARQITETKLQFYALSFFSFGTLIFFSFWFVVLGIMVWTFTPTLPNIIMSFYSKFQTATTISEYFKVILQSILLFITLLGVVVFVFRLAGLIRFALHSLFKKENETGLEAEII